MLHGDTAPPRCGVSHGQEVLPSRKDQLCPHTAPSCIRLCALGASGVTLLWGWVRNGARRGPALCGVGWQLGVVAVVLAGG